MAEVEQDRNKLSGVIVSRQVSSLGSWSAGRPALQVHGYQVQHRSALEESQFAGWSAFRDSSLAYRSALWGHGQQEGHLCWVIFSSWIGSPRSFSVSRSALWDHSKQIPQSAGVSALQEARQFISLWIRAVDKPQPVGEGALRQCCGSKIIFSDPVRIQLRVIF